MKKYIPVRDPVKSRGLRLSVGLPDKLEKFFSGRGWNNSNPVSSQWCSRGSQLFARLHAFGYDFKAQAVRQEIMAFVMSLSSAFLVRSLIKERSILSSFIDRF
jgi:hypothetical protein